MVSDIVELIAAGENVERILEEPSNRPEEDKLIEQRERAERKFNSAFDNNRVFRGDLYKEIEEA